MYYFLLIPGLIFLTFAYFKWLRPWQLTWGATPEEILREMPGDGIINQPSFNATRAVTINASPEHIYPWILQMGLGRAGWYSYDFLDNLARPSAKVIIPELQKIHAGQVIPMSPDGKQGIRVNSWEENHWILWGDETGGTTWVWEFVPLNALQTRLITRVRVKYTWNSWELFFNLLIEFTDIIMMRKCMLGIKQRAEELQGAQ